MHVGQETSVDPNSRRVVMSPLNRKRGLAALAATFMATGAIATPESGDSRHISYVPAELTQPEAAQRLYLRIQRVARVVCHEPEMRDLSRYRVYQQCYDRAVDNAVANVNATALTALHRSKTQRNAAG
jgi:UrcA family protein